MGEKQKIATGSTGNAVQDGSVRASYLAAVNAAAGLLCLAFDAKPEVIVMVTTITTFVGIATYGAFDKFVKPRL